MTDPHDPFEDGDVERIYSEVMSGQINDAVAESHEELDRAVSALDTLTAKLRTLIPPAAVINFITSLAVGTAVSAVYENHDA